MQHILLDLDGTLTDPREGIVGCIQHALTALGLEAPPPRELERFIGPPLAQTFRILLGETDEERVERAIAVYRERFGSTGIYENAVYGGIPAALAALVRAGCRLHLVTVKPEPFAQRVLRHFDLEQYFISVHAPDLGAREVRKAALIRQALERHRIDPPTAAMVGDRAEDVEGARENRVTSIAVTWGHGSRAELEVARPDRIVDSVGDLVTALGVANTRS
jgi:phosphoglycolate phosphatase